MSTHGLVACAALAAALALPAAAGAACPASRVHYGSYAGAGQGLGAVPWIAGTPAASGLVGHLFYYGATPWSRRRLAGARIYVGGAHGAVHMKVLWVARRRGFGGRIVLRGRRLDGPGSFRDAYPATTAGFQFPSYVVVPSRGCWRIGVSSGSLSATVTFLAVAG